jgi:hypothetical protein
MRLTTTPSERIGRCTRMRRFSVRFNRSESFVHTRSSAAFTIITSGFEFSVHTGGCRRHPMGRHRRKQLALFGKSFPLQEASIRAHRTLCDTEAVDWMTLWMPKCLCVPKIRFCNIDGEGRQGQVVRRRRRGAQPRDGEGRPCSEIDESSTHYNSRHIRAGSGAGALRQTRSCGRDIRGGSSR